MSKTLTPPTTHTSNFASTDFASRLYARPMFEKHYPALAALKADLQGMKNDAGQTPQAVCAMTQRCHFAPLIAETHSTMPVLVFFLPQAFEPLLPQLAMTEISVHNWTALDLSRNLTYCSWYVRETQTQGSNASYLSVWLPEYVFHAYIQESAKRSPNLMSLVDGEGVFHPIVFVAGETVTVGRFWEDDELHVHVGLADQTAREHNPKVLSTEQQRADAKCHAINPTPWRHQMHTIAPNALWPHQHVIEPAAYNYLDWRL